MGVSFPGESVQYRVARDRLLEREAELRRLSEAVAVARRELPPGGPVPQDYVFQEAGPDGSAAGVRLSGLFAPGKDSLVIYSFMFPRALDEDLPCPSCTAFLDTIAGAAGHLAQRVSLAVAAKAPLPRVLAHARQRGWLRLRLLSSAQNTYNRDYHGESADGSQMPILNVFRRDGELIRHFWAGFPESRPGEPPRGRDGRGPDAGPGRAHVNAQLFRAHRSAGNRGTLAGEDDTRATRRTPGSGPRWTG